MLAGTIIRLEDGMKSNSRLRTWQHFRVIRDEQDVGLLLWIREVLEKLFGHEILVPYVEDAVAIGGTYVGSPKHFSSLP